MIVRIEGVVAYWRGFKQSVVKSKPGTCYDLVFTPKLSVNTSKKSTLDVFT